MILRPRGWEKFQHYKTRRPPWIKLHKQILEDREFMRLPVASKALAPLLWLLASESEDAKIDASIDELTFRLRLTKDQIEEALNPLVDNGLFDVVDGGCLQDASKALVQRREETKETREEVPPQPPKGGARKRAVPCPEDVDPDTWKDWQAVRTAKRAGPVTKTVLTRVTNQAKKAGISLQEAIAIAAARGWQSFEAGWVKDAHRNGAPKAGGPVYQDKISDITYERKTI